MQKDRAQQQPFVDAYLALADMPPIRTVVGISWGVDQVNAAKQPIQDAILKGMQLEAVLGGASA